MSMKRRKRRSCDDDEKHRIVARMQVSVVPVSQLARRYDVNANLVFKWLRDPRFTPTTVDDPAESYLPVEVVAAPALPLIDPQACLTDTPSRVTDHKITKLDKLIPWRYAQHRA